MRIRRPANAGFSVVELLVALGVIAIISAVLFPVFVTARRDARMTACASNLHQVGLSLRMYANDNNGDYPPNNVYIRDAVGDHGQLVWGLLTPYTHNTQVFHCPDERGRFDKILGYEYRVGLRGEPTDPYTKPPQPGSGTVVAVCSQHTERSGDDGWVIDASGHEIGPLIVVREDGSTSRIQASRVEGWAYQAGRWRLLGSGAVCPIDAYCDYHFPGEEWPPELEPSTVMENPR